jgi:hypothetical protein
MPGVKIKLNKKFKDELFFQFILPHDFFINLALKQCDPSVVTPVGTRVNSFSEFLMVMK